MMHAQTNIKKYKIILTALGMVKMVPMILLLRMAEYPPVELHQ
jgi:hypothetical protein